MIQEMLNRFLSIVIAIDIFAIGILVMFLANFRIIIRRRITEREFFFRILSLVQKSDTTEHVAQIMNLSVPEVTRYCKKHSIELPEARIARIEAAKQQEEDANRRILEEEATWRAEQERHAEERQREKEIEMKNRKERLRKFGIT